MTRTTRKEMVEGVFGNGATKYMVVTVDVTTGQWLHVESFTSKAEAQCWFTYA